MTERRSETHHVHYDPSTDVTVSQLLVLAVADIDDTGPLELDPLYGTVDPDALDDLVETGGTTDVQGRISFAYEGYDVTVHASGLIELTPAD